MPATQQLDAGLLTGPNGSETCKTDLSDVLLIKRSVLVTLRCLCSLFTSFHLGLLDSLLKVLFPVGLPLKDLQCMVHSATWLKYWFVPNRIEHADACMCYMICFGRVGPLTGNQPWHPIFKQFKSKLVILVYCLLQSCSKQPDKSDIADQMRDRSSQQSTHHLNAGSHGTRKKEACLLLQAVKIAGMSAHDQKSGSCIYAWNLESGQP